MSCPIKIDLSKASALKNLKDFCGLNTTQFFKYFNKVVKEQESDGTIIPTDEFKTWYEEHYKTPLNFDKGEGVRMREAIIKYYNESTPSVKAANRKTTSYNPVIVNGYESANDRSFAKKHVAEHIKEFYDNLERNYIFTDPAKYENAQLIRAKYVAESIIRKSKLNDETKLQYLNHLKSLQEVGQIRNFLTSKNLNGNFNIKAKDKTFCFNIAKNRIIEELAEAVSNKSDLSKQEIITRIRKGRLSANEIESILGGDNMSLTDKNRFAVYKEFVLPSYVNKINSDRLTKGEYDSLPAEEKKNYKLDDSFIEEVCRTKELKDIRFAKDDELDNEEDLKAVDAEISQDGESNPEDGNLSNDDTNITISMYDHSGTYTTVMAHVDTNIRTYLSTLKKLNSDSEIDGRADYNLDNPLGVPTCMDADECCTILYSSVDYTSPETMIQSIRTIADTIEGCAAFHTLAKELENNKDFCYAFYRTFGKLVVSKIITGVNNGKPYARISNTRSNKKYSLRQEYLNNLKYTSLTNDLDDVKSKVDNIKNKIRLAGENVISDFDIRDVIINDITKELKKFYPNITEYAVRSYITNNKVNNVVNIQSNITSLIKILDDTIEASKATKRNFDYRAIRITKAYKENAKLAEKEEKDPDKYIDVNSLYREHYISDKHNSIVITLADMLSDYSVVRVELNSTNVNNNQSSDVINSNMLSGILKTLQNDESLENFGKFRFKSRQYDFSNIMLERVNEKGQIENPGLFRKDITGKITPTEYAKDLLSLNLYDGAKNEDTDSSSLYKEMSGSDYIASAFIAFNEPTSLDTTIKNFQTAKYFMRTPSDAPKNFVVTAPKLSVKGLFKHSNTDEINNILKDQEQKLVGSILSAEQMKEVVTANNKKNILKIYDIDIFNKLFTSTGIRNYAISPYYRKSLNKYKDQDITLAFQYIDKSEEVEDEENKIQNDKNIFFIKGHYDGETISNIEFVGISNEGIDINIKKNLRETTRTKLEKEGKYKYSVSRTHPIFNNFRNIFKQEILNAAIAIDTLFVTHENGCVARDSNDEIMWKQPNTKNGYEIDGCFDNYHHKKGVIVKKNSDGTEYLVGNVFHSDRFVLYDEEKGEEVNYGDKLMQQLFNFLYGGESGNFIQVIKDSNDKEASLHGYSTIKEINISPEIQDKIDDMIEQFILKYIEQGYQVLQSTDNINENGTVQLNHDTAGEFLLNYHLTYNSFGDLFEGDSKFYKDTQTFLKRAKEVQGSGVPYGFVNFTDDFDVNTKTVVHTSALNAMRFDDGTITVDQNDNVSGGYQVKQYNRFTGITIKNSIITNKETLKILKDRLTAKDINLSEKAANALIYGPKGDGGYQDINANNAQSYITFDEFIRRIAGRGQLYKHKALIEKILRGEDLNAQDLEEFVQVQKNFYYNVDLKDSKNLFAPNQIKNSEFVLIPQLIKGTELEQVYNLMTKYGIDQLNTEETSKAGKSNTLEIWDAKTGTLKQDIVDELNDPEHPISDFGTKVENAKKLYDYRFLYTQQETPQHANAQNKAGIQIMKKIIDNISEGSALYETKKHFIDCYCSKIKGSFVELMRELKVPLDSQNNPIMASNGVLGTTISKVDFRLLYEKLKNELFRLGLDSNMVDYVTLDTIQIGEDGNVTIMPNFMSMVSQKLESMAQAIFNNNITRQKLPGFHAAQVTNIGFKSFGEKVQGVTYDKNLKYHTTEDGKYCDYVEVMVPASFFGLNRYDKDGNIKSKEDLLKELQDAKLDDIIGYRIPTEGKQSICKMKVVGFIDDAYGSTIVVPNEWVAQTGSDFDIDSVYGIQHATQIKYDGTIEKVKYSDLAGESYDNYIRSKMSDSVLKDVNKIIKEQGGFSYENWATEHGFESREDWSKEHQLDVMSDNSRNAIDNELVDCMLKILSNPASLEENLSRSNFDDIKDAIKDIMKPSIKEKRNSRSPYSFLDQAAYMEDAMSGAKLKAFSVTRDSFCSVCNTIRPTLIEKQAIKVIYSTDVISKEDAIKRFGENNVESVKGSNIKITFDKFGWTNDNRNIIGKLLTAYSSQTTAHQLDIIKEGAVPNVNDFTFGVYKLFPDLGMDYNTAVAFMLQDGISRIVKHYNISKSVYKDSTTKPIDSAIKEIASELFDGMDLTYKTLDDTIKLLKKHFGSEFKKLWNGAELSIYTEDNAELALNSQEMIDEVKHPRSGKEKLLYDLGIILMFNKLNNLSSIITKTARLCNPDRFGAKQTIFETNKVFDDISDLIENNIEDFPLQVGESNFLSAIYPGIEKGLDSFISSPVEESKYPPLYYFLKYSTAPSIKINRMLFDTQKEGFINFVKGLEDRFSGDKKFNEKLYKSFEKYIIGRLYDATGNISLPIKYVRTKDFTGFDFDIPIDSKSDILESAKEIEKSRIFGYSADAVYLVEKSYKDGEPVLEPFSVKNLNNPTDDELKEFAKMTPAQKVIFIKENFRDRGLFDYIEPNINNTEGVGKYKYGFHSLSFIDTSKSIEDVYIDFENAFTSTNPLIALAAYDVIKYAFVVEGYNMTKTGVSRMIPNSLLYNDFGINGTGIVEALRHQMSTIESVLTDSVYEDYLRSHSTNSNIDFAKVKKVNGKYELTKDDDFIVLELNAEDADKRKNNRALAEKYHIIYTKGKDYDINKYVRLSFGSNSEVLYKIEEVYNGMVVLYPLNNLEENEHGVFSANPQNNKYASSEYYNLIINDYFKDDVSSFNTTDFKAVRELKTKKDYKFKTKKKSENRLATPIDFDNPTIDIAGSVYYLDKETKRFFEDKNNLDSRLFLRLVNFDKYIKYPGSANGLSKDFIINEGKENEQVVTTNIVRLSKDTINKHIKYYLSEKGRTASIKKADKDYERFINELRAERTITDENIHSIPIYEVVGYRETQTKPSTDEPTIMKSAIRENHVVTLGDVASQIYRGIGRRSSFEIKDKDAAKIKAKWTNKNITSNNVRESAKTILESSAQYISGRVNHILDTLKYFEKDPDTGEFMSIIDPRVLDIIKDDPVIREKYLETIAEAKALTKQFGLIKELDIKSEDESLQFYLKTIKDAVTNLENDTTIKTAQVYFADKYLSTLSTNPLVRQDIASILDGFWSTNAFTAAIGDLQETSNPLIQIISKRVINNLTIAENRAKEEVRKLRHFKKDIEARAAQEGLSVSLDNMIDENGDWILSFSKELTDTLDKLYTDILQAKQVYGAGSIESLKAQLAYDKFKLEHVNQKYVDDYYREKIEADEYMIEKHPIIFAEYNRLIERRKEIQSYINKGTIDQALEQELQDINKQIRDLRDENYVDMDSHTIKEKPIYDDINPLSGTEEEKRKKILNSFTSAKALNNYIEKQQKINEKYFEKDAIFGFEEELERNLKIIANREKRNPIGDITVPMSELMEDEEYVKAKEWITKNAIFKLKKENKEEINNAFKAIRKKKKSSIFKELIAKRNARTSTGEIDGTKFTDEDIEAIREDELKDYNTRESSPLSDTILIRSKHNDGVVYNEKFYQGMTSDGQKTKEYLDIVQRINDLLAPYYDNPTRLIKFEKIPDTKEGIAVLNELAKLYDELEEIKKTEGSSNGKEVHKFIENNVEFVVDEDEYKRQESFIQGKSIDFRNAWRRANRILVDGKSEINHYIYGYAKPKAGKEEQFIDKEKSDALKLIKETYTTTPTSFYYEKSLEMKKKGKKAFEDWYYKNHIYNPNTHMYQPLKCWMTFTYRNEDNNLGEWIPNFTKEENTPKETTLNKNFKKGVGNSMNYKEGTGFDNPAYKNLNKYEIELRTHIQSLFNSLARIESARRYLNKGHLPYEHKKKEEGLKGIGKELAKTVGWVEGEDGKKPFFDDDEIDYAYDVVRDMPMLHKLDQITLTKDNLNAPLREPGETDEQYLERVKEKLNKVQEIKEKNVKAHKEAISRDWWNVFEDFIMQASHYNAIQDNKMLLYYGRDMLDDLEVYQRKYGFFGDYKTFSGVDNSKEYITKHDDNLKKQYINWSRRLIHDQWKKPNSEFTKWASRLQSITSAQYMMMNIRGGIANVTLGQTQMYAEAVAGQYLDRKELLKGMAMWSGAVPSFLTHLYKENSSSLVDAIIKHFNVVDYDEQTGKSRIVEDPASKYITRFRNSMFAPQTVGEHYMQNSTLLGMLLSHRLCEVDGKLVFMNEQEFINRVYENTLMEILSDEQKAEYEKFKRTIASDANVEKDYALFRKDITHDFLKKCSVEQQREFAKKRKENTKLAKDEFNNDEIHPTILSQLELTEDGYMGIKEGTLLSKYNVPNEKGEPSDAEKILADFRGRVISVNKKIHGVYDKLGQAQIENTWWGSLAMQYHKHIYPGILKRYRREGFYNEQRGTIEKGCFISLIDFIKTPIDSYKTKKKLNDAEIKGLESIKMLFKELLDFATHINLNWNLLPDYEKANIRRYLANWYGVMAALFASMAIRALADDDDEEGILYNLSLYEADRLSQESFQFNPYGMMTQFRTLWSTPIAAQSGIQDLVQSAGLFTKFLREGSDFDPYYHSGRYAGEYKLSVYVQRRIPIWRGIKTGFIDIAESNSYYKIGKDPLQFGFTEKWLEWADEHGR